MFSLLVKGVSDFIRDMRPCLSFVLHYQLMVSMDNFKPI